VLQEPTPAIALKRPASPDVKPQPLPTRPIPMAVWEDHLLPLLTGKDAGRLGGTCKALRAMLREKFRGDVGAIKMEHLKGALTTFPAARKVALDISSYPSKSPEVEPLVQWLLEGGRGRRLERLTKTDEGDEESRDLVHMALQAGALPSLKNRTPPWNMTSTENPSRKGS
jgi:hypothetical protein